MNCVITSYSIHYTKLYEAASSLKPLRALFRDVWRDGDTDRRIEIEEAARVYLRKIDDLGGAVAAIPFMQREIQDAASYNFV